MIISDSRKFIFWHVPKSGGGTISNALRAHSSSMPLGGAPRLDHTDFGNTKDHCRPKDCLTSQAILARMQAYFKFVFCRNPYDRLYSAYAWRREDYVKIMKGRDLFSLFVSEKLYPYVTEHGRHFFPGTVPAHEYAQCGGKWCVDFVGRTESLSDHFRTIARRLGIEDVVKKNQNVLQLPIRGYKYLDQYEPKAIALVNDLYRADFELFGYPVLDPKTYLAHKGDGLDLPPIVPKDLR